MWDSSTFKVHGGGGGSLVPRLSRLNDANLDVAFQYFLLNKTWWALKE